MKYLLCAIAGLVIGIATTWAVMNSQMHEQLHLARSEADQRLAAAQKQLTAKTEENAVFKKLNGELSEHAQALQKKAEQQPAAPQPAAAPAKEENPFAAFFSKDKMKAMMRTQLDMKLAALKTRLNLTDYQFNELNAAAQRDADGSFGPDSRPHAHDGQGLEATLGKILNPQQQQEYTKIKAEDQRNASEMVANSELMQLQAATPSLSEAQKDQAFQVFSQEAQRMMSPESGKTKPVAANAAGNSPDQNVQTMLEDLAQRKKEGLRSILTPEQFDAYSKQMDMQTEMAKKMMEAFKPKAPGK